ncbi:hypothetical protein, variant 1 [Aphanomyces invadans]|uniref:Uncharacterized protein n=1 Tax=Aphanomyces invadans TaxID=157072 RepID=A0A024TQ07_9STRA|nr:hypothetical protein, variant 1 [Aphanomyces invadans]ETV96094.1 hypothetical protein, variant 1 [Aphanomyces invadans]|eukprot:XP_008875405.1 hypothetical protein, variant 1 [Aphanomyces invadans]
MVDLGKLARVDWASHARVALATSQAMIPYAAIGSSILFALAPLPDIRRIRRAKHTLSLPFLPFFFYALQSAIFLVYAWVTANPVLKTTTSLGVLLGTYYLAVYYTYSSDKVVARKWMAGGFAVVLALMGIAATWEAADAAMMIGLPGALHILSLAMAAMVPTKCGPRIELFARPPPLIVPFKLLLCILR